MHEIKFDMSKFNTLDSNCELQYGLLLADSDGRIYKVLAVNNQEAGVQCDGSYMIKVYQGDKSYYEFLDKPIESFVKLPLLLSIEDGSLCSYDEVKDSITLYSKDLYKGTTKKFYADSEDFDFDKIDLNLIDDFSYREERIKWKGMIKSVDVGAHYSGVVSVGDYISYIIGDGIESLFVRVDRIEFDKNKTHCYVYANDSIIPFGDIRKLIKKKRASWETIE